MLKLLQMSIDAPIVVSVVLLLVAVYLVHVYCCYHVMLAIFSGKTYRLNSKPHSVTSACQIVVYML